MAPHRIWLAVAIMGLLTGLGLSLASPQTMLSHLGLVLAIGAPVIAFYRAMKPAIGKRHCPARSDWSGQ